MPDETASIPVLDMGPFGLDPASPAASAFVEELRGAVHEVGFFYLVGHDVDPGRFDRVHLLLDHDRHPGQPLHSTQYRQ